MQLKELLEQSAAFRFVIEQLELSAPLTRRYLYDLEWERHPARLEEAFERVATMQHFLAVEANQARFRSLKHLLSQLHDLKTTLSALERSVVMNDIELFEIKSLAMLAGEIRREVADFELCELPDLQAVFSLLDPDISGLASFYIYDSYSPTLAELRRAMKTASDNERAALFAQATTEEDAVRLSLSEQLQPFAAAMSETLALLAELDLLIAKAELATKEHYCRPRMVEQTTRFRALFNPQVAAALALRQKKFQPIDITLDAAPTLITGMNMGGKTVVLKSLAAAQMLCQFGFYLPAAEAEVVAVDAVVMVIDELQDTIGGLSSFAAEMMQLDALIVAVKQGDALLALIDEPARTTNPTEGRALVEALLEILGNYSVRSLMTSHYDHIATPCRRLRVRGFRATADYVDVRQLEFYIDYALEADDSQNVPHEALRIARMLRIDKELVDRAQVRLKE